MIRLFALSVLLVASMAWGDDKSQPYPCEDKKTYDASYICYQSESNTVRAYCDAPTYGAMPRVLCYDFEAKAVTTFGEFAKANPLDDEPKPDNWLCIDKDGYYACGQPERLNEHLEGGNWVCLDYSDRKIRKCSEMSMLVTVSGDWSIIEIPRSSK